MKKIRIRTLEDRFYVTFTLLFFISIVTMQIVSFRISIQTVSSNNAENNQILLSQLISQINAYLGSIETLSQTIAEDPYSREFLESPTTPSPELSRQVQERLSLALRARDDVSGILLARPDGTLVNGDPSTRLAPWADLYSRPWIQEALANPGRTIISPSYVQNLVENRYAWVVSLVHAVEVPNQPEPALLMVDMRFTRIQELSLALVNGEQGYAFILDREGNYVFHPTLQLVYSGIKTEPLDELRTFIPGLAAATPGNLESWVTGDQRYLLGRSNFSGWTVVSVSSEEELMADWQIAQVIFALIGLVVFLIIGWISNYLAKSITQPVHRLQEVMRSVETGEFTRAGVIEGTDEIKELAREYDLMVTRISELVTANAREQELKRKSDLKALQAQINPHFLYNTLDSIIWMGEMGQNTDVVKMTSALARLFRISISKGKELISLKDEVNHVVSYLTIQEMRYKKKFTYHLAIPPTLESCRVLKITLQPLVENAIYHGVRDLSRPGTIHISARIEGNSLILEVQDNGQGMSLAEQKALRDNLDQPFDEVWEEALYGGSPSSGTGVRNVHQRIRLYFGETYGLTLESAEGQGTLMRATLPLVGIEEDL